MALPNNGSHDDLAALFAQYREACPAPELTSNFMPGVWHRIEARRGFSLSVGRLSRRFVTAAAALCLLMAILLAIPQAQSSGAGYSSTYLEALATDHSSDDIPFTEIDRRDGGLE